jgi:hypothetical protein
MAGPLSRLAQQARIPHYPVGQAAAAAPDEPSSIVTNPTNQAIRVQMAGGQLLQLLMPEAITPVEQVYRRLPNEGLYTATPQNSFVTELGSYRVQQSQVLLLLDYRFDVYQPGAAAGDALPVAPRQLAVSLGWDVTFSQMRRADLRYELLPSPASATRQAFAQRMTGGNIPSDAAGQGYQAGQNEFDAARFQSGQGPSGAGLAMQPQRHRRDAQLDLPFTFVVPANNTITFRSIAFQAVPIPIAFLEAEWSGVILGANTFDLFLKNQALRGSGTGGV